MTKKPQPLAAPLPARSGEQIVTPEFLLSIPLQYDSSRVQWIDNEAIVFCSPSKTQKNEGLIERYNITTEQRTIICKGSNPIHAILRYLIRFARALTMKRRVLIEMLQSFAKLTSNWGVLKNWLLLREQLTIYHTCQETKTFFL